jgi:hypothetical protein
LFSGPCIENVTRWDKVVLIGDASHPLAGMSSPSYLLWIQAKTSEGPLVRVQLSLWKTVGL